MQSEGFLHKGHLQKENGFLIMASEKMDDLAEAVSSALKDVIEGILKKSEINLTQNTEIIQREVIEYNSRMRIVGMEKFNGPCYVCGLSFYKSPENQQKKVAQGAFAFYVNVDCVESLLKKFGHRGFDEEDDEFILDQLGSLTRSMAEAFAVELKNIGYDDLTISEPHKFKNNIPEGLNFPYSFYNYQELAFYAWDKKAMVANVIMAKP